MTTGTIFSIIACQFIQIKSSYNGGAVFVSNTNSEFNQRFNEFSDNSGLDGGSVYINVKRAYSYGICIAYSKGGRGSGIYQICNSNNHMNSSATIHCSATNFATWDLCYGIATANHVNTSYCSSPNREAASHYGCGTTICSTSFFTCCANTGPGIFGPLSTQQSLMPHSFCNFIRNKPDKLGVIILWNGEHQFIKCVFLLNDGVTSSSGQGVYVGKGTLLYVNCCFDTSPSGYYLSTSNCQINKNPTTYFPIISVTGICKVHDFIIEIPTQSKECTSGYPSKSRFLSFIVVVVL